MPRFVEEIALRAAIGSLGDELENVEQTYNDLKNRLTARAATNSEVQRWLEKEIKDADKFISAVNEAMREATEEEQTATEDAPEGRQLHLKHLLTQARNVAEQMTLRRNYLIQKIDRMRAQLRLSEG